MSFTERCDGAPRYVYMLNITPVNIKMDYFTYLHSIIGSLFEYFLYRPVASKHLRRLFRLLCVLELLKDSELLEERLGFELVDVVSRLLVHPLLVD